MTKVKQSKKLSNISNMYLVIGRKMKSDNIKSMILTLGVVGGFLGVLNGMNHSVQQPLFLTKIFLFILLVSIIVSLILFFTNKK